MTNIVSIILLVAVWSTVGWVYFSPTALECQARGGFYYLGRGCGEYVWHSR
jgi:hypothetical protein